MIAWIEQGLGRPGGGGCWLTGTLLLQVSAIACGLWLDGSRRAAVHQLCSAQSSLALLAAMCRFPGTPSGPALYILQILRYGLVVNNVQICVSGYCDENLHQLLSKVLADIIHLTNKLCNDINSV